MAKPGSSRFIAAFQMIGPQHGKERSLTISGLDFSDRWKKHV